MLTTIAFGIFLTVLLVLYGGYFVYAAVSGRLKMARRLKERVQDWPLGSKGGEATIVRKELLSGIPWLDARLRDQWALPVLRRLHAQSGTRTSLGLFLLASGMLCGLALVLGGTLRFPLPQRMMLAVAAGLLPVWYLRRCKVKRLAAFQRQFPEALDLIARALKAGHAFFVGLQIAGSEMAEPIGGEFKRAYEEVSIGVSVPEALEHLAERVDCPDVRYFVTAVSIQRETGGNLAEVVEGLGSTIRKRFELQEKVKALSAEGVLSAIILFILPIAMGVLLYLVNPAYASLLMTDPIGRNMVAVGLCLMVTGGFVTRRLIAIKV